MRDPVSRANLLVRFRMASSLDDLKSIKFWKAVAAEALGTLLLVFVGCGSCLSWEDPTRIPKSDYNPVVQIAFCFGMSVATIVWGIGHISGGHINPAVTIAFFVTRKISLAKTVLYILAQCCGAIVGALILKEVTPGQRWGTLGKTYLNTEIGPGRAFGVEFMITFILVFTVFACCDGKRNDLHGSAPLTIGLSVTMCHLFAVPLTGSSMNSARSFGPAVAMNLWTNHWVYWIGPILGGVVASLLYEYIFAANLSINKVKKFLMSSRYYELPTQEKTMNTLDMEEETDNVVYKNFKQITNDLGSKLIPQDQNTHLLEMKEKTDVNTNFTQTMNDLGSRLEIPQEQCIRLMEMEEKTEENVNMNFNQIMNDIGSTLLISQEQNIHLLELEEKTDDENIDV